MDNGLSDDTYREIKAYAIARMAKTKDSGHDDKHILRVKNNALKIVRLLELEGKIDKNLLKATCLLHDFTYSVRKPSTYTYIFEGSIEKHIIRTVLEKFSLSDTSKKIIIDAVYRHAHSFPFRKLNRGHDIYTKILQDADTLDYFDCLRVGAYMRKHDRGIFGDIKKKLTEKFIKYGLTNLSSFLNYPELAKSFFPDRSRECL
jgi:hypothetical protein